MRINVKLLTIGAILLASLSLLLQGCGSYTPGTSSEQLTRRQTGKVMDPTTGSPIAGAYVTAYKIVNGVKLPEPKLCETTQTRSDGVYSLQIPISYTGAYLIEAEIIHPLSKVVSKVLKTVLDVTSGTGSTIIRAIVPEVKSGQTSLPPVNISFASEAVVTFIEENVVKAAAANVPDNMNQAAGFSSDNIKKSTIMLETLFGAGFTETIAADNTDATAATTTSKSQQDLLVSIRAVQAVLSNPDPGNADAPKTMQDLVKQLVRTDGLGETANTIKTAIATVTDTLITEGTLPTTYTPSNAVIAAISNAQSAPVATPDLAQDTTPPSIPASLVATAVNAKTVALTWSASTDDTGVEGYQIHRADSNGNYSLIDQVMSSASGTFSYSDPTVLPGSTYTYKILAFDVARNYSNASTIASVATPAIAVVADVIKPDKPQGLVVNWFTDSQAYLTWQQATKVDSKGVVHTATGYNLYRNDQMIATLTDNAYTDAAVTPSTRYTYYVKAFDGNANVSDASTPITVVTAKPAVVVKPPPTAPTALTASGNNIGKVTLTWSNPNATAVTYNVYRGSALLVSGISTLKYTDSTVPLNSEIVTYTYRVTAVNDDGESTEATVTAVVEATVVQQTPPSIPKNLGLVTATSSSAVLTWAASTKTDDDYKVSGYDILRASDGSEQYVVITSVTTPGYTDSTLAESSTYKYKIKSYSSKGVRSDASAVLTVATSAKIVEITDKTPPTVPTGLALKTAPTSSTVSLTWTASTDNEVKASGLAGYRVYRDGVQIASVNDTKYTDSSATASTTYVYSVKAYDNIGNVSAGSTPLTVTTDIPPESTFSVSGRVTFNGIGIPAVLVSLSGTTLTGSTVTGAVGTDANGYYTITGLLRGVYTLTPSSQAAITFTPNYVQTVIALSNSIGLNFVASGGQVTGSTTTPSNSITGGLGYPAGTIIGGISYPKTTVIGGITYTTATIIGGVTYNTGTVIGGITYVNGVVVGGIAYPKGTVIGGVALPPGTVITQSMYPTGTVSTSTATYPAGTVIGGITVPAGSVPGNVYTPTYTVIAGVSYVNSNIAAGITTATATLVNGVTYSTGTVTGGITYPNGVVIGNVFYPPGTVVGGVAYPSGTVTANVTSYPSGTVVGGITYPNSTVVSGVTYTTSTVIGGIVVPTGTVVGGVSYPSGVVIGGVQYPAGTVVGGVAYPPSAVSGVASYPTGTLFGGITIPEQTVSGGVTYPTATIIDGVKYPSGTVVGGQTYPNGVTIAGVTYPAGTVVGGVAFPPGSVVASTFYPSGTVTSTDPVYPSGVLIAGHLYPTGLVSAGAVYPASTVVSGVTYPVGAISGGITYPKTQVIDGVTYATETVSGSSVYPTGGVIGGVRYSDSVVIGGVTYPAGTVVGGVAFPPGSLTAELVYPTASVSGNTVYPTGVLISGAIYPIGMVINGQIYPTGTVNSGTTTPGATVAIDKNLYPSGTIIGGITYASVTVIGGVTYATSTVLGGNIYPTGAVVGGVTYPQGVIIAGIYYPPGP